MAKHRRRPGGGRHRLGSSPLLVHCRQVGQVRARLEATRAPWGVFRMRGRHTVAALTRSGARPRPAFALIISL
jgi:hypothetical protein